MVNPTRLYLKPLNLYEHRLLSVLAFFRTKRQPTTQAHHCLSMYLRQSQPRIMSEVEFYATRVGMTVDKLMDLICENPDEAQNLIDGISAVEFESELSEQPEEE